MILLEVLIMLRLKFYTDHIALRLIYGVLELLHIYSYVEAARSGRGQNLESFALC